METFSGLSLDPALQRAVTELGFTKPSEIQAQALPILLGEPTDFIGLAATGTGKTAAFSLPLLQKLDRDAKGVQAIILCPTRELCLQVAGQIDLLGKFMGVRALPIYGGAGYDEQLRGLRAGARIVVGTPGRVIDHIERGTLKLDQVKVVVLDEADEMISMGFREDMETILAEIPAEQRKTWLFSATMSAPVRKISSDFLREPQKVQVNRTEMLSSGVQQICYFTQERNKPEILCKLIDAADDFYGIIFCQMKSLVSELTNYLNERGYKADCLHGDMSQAAREVAMTAFRERRRKILVCTDVAARGLDVKDVTHVVNYSLPREIENYVHRIGRTARSGKTGFALALVTPQHRYLLNKIEAVTKSQFTEGVVPTRKEIGMKKIAQLLPQFSGVANAERAQSLLGEEWKTALEGMTGEEVAARFLSLQYPWVFVDEVRPPAMSRPATRSEERSENRPYAEKRPYGNRPAHGDKRAYGSKPAGEKRAHGDKPAYGEKRAYGKKAPFAEKPAFSRDGEDRPKKKGYVKDENRPHAKERHAARKERAAKFQDLRTDSRPFGGEKRKLKSDFSKGPFAKFAKKRPDADAPPRRRPD